MTVSEQVVSETPLVIEESVEYTIDKQIVIDQEEHGYNDDHGYEPAVVEEQMVTTVVINNESNDGMPDDTKEVDNSILIHTLSPNKVSRRNRSLTQNTGLLKSEEEAKVMASPFIAKIDSRPPKYRCLFKDSSISGDDCDYINSRLLMTQCHVYKHLDIFLHHLSVDVAEHSYQLIG